MARLAWIALLPALAIGACAQGGFADAGEPDLDAGSGEDAGRDAGRRDAGRISLPDAGRDAGPMRDAGMSDAGRMPDAGRDAGMGACAPSASTIAIVEVMVSSRTGAGDLGEWFEVKNIGSCTVNLAGLVIDSPTSGSPRTHMVTGGIVAPGESWVFAQSGDSAQNHGLGHDYVYGSTIIFENGTDSLGLTFDGAEIDRVAWTSTDFMHSASRQLSIGAMPTANSDLGTTSWCNSTNVYSSATGGPFLGTPQMNNATCP